MPTLGQFANSPARIMAQVLIDAGFATEPPVAGTSIAWPVVVNSNLDTPDEALEVHDTEPQRFGRVQATGESSQLWAFQLTVRSADPVLNYRKMNDLEVFLEQVLYARQTQVTTDSTIATYLVGRVTRTSGPLYLGKEGSQTKRHVRTYNAIVDIIQLS